MKSTVLRYDAALRYFDLEYGANILSRNVRKRLPNDAAHIPEERKTQLHCYDNRKKNAVRSVHFISRTYVGTRIKTPNPFSHIKQ